MEARKSMLLSSQLPAQSLLRKSFFRNCSRTLLTICSATAVEGGFTVTVPMAEEGKAPIAGQTYAVLTGCNTTVTDDTVAAGPAVFEVAAAFA